jgi:1-acyl-sn-glycerol-3-phosphate acyltransferase
MFAEAVECSSPKKLSKGRRVANNPAMTPSRSITEIATAKSLRLIARAVAAGRLQTVVSGTEHIPTVGPALIVARHYHHLFDGLALFAAIPRQFHIIVTLDWVQNAPMRLLMEQLTRLARWPVVLRAEALMRLDGTDVSQFRHAFSVAEVEHYQNKAFRESVRVLEDNRLLVVFPEGYPNIDPTYTPKRGPACFLPFKRGFVAIARATEGRLGTSLPIIPTGLRYTVEKAWTAHVRFSQPVRRESFASSNDLIRYCENTVKQLSS